MLLQELQYVLLRRLRLLDSGKAGLLQDVFLGQVRGCRRNVGILHAILRAGQVLDLSVFNVCIGGELVDGCADAAALCRNRVNR